MESFFSPGSPASSPSCSWEALISEDPMEGSKFSRLRAAVLPADSTSASGARCFTAAATGAAGAVAETSGKVTGATGATETSGISSGLACSSGTVSSADSDAGAGIGTAGAFAASTRPASLMEARVTSTRLPERGASDWRDWASSCTLRGFRNVGMGTSPIGGTSSRWSFVTSIGGVAAVAKGSATSAEATTWA